MPNVTLYIHQFKMNQRTYTKTQTSKTTGRNDEKIQNTDTGKDFL